MQDYCFVSGSDCTEVEDVLMLLESDCQQCLGKRQHFCLEKSCNRVGPFCYRCEGSDHVLHRVNDLRMVFVDRKIVKCTHAQARHYLQELIDILAGQKKRCDEAIRQSTKMSAELSRVLQHFQSKLAELTELNSLSRLYTLVEEAVRENRNKYRNMYEQEQAVQLKDETQANIRLQFDRLFKEVDFAEEFRFEEHPLFLEVTSRLEHYLTEVMQAGISSCGYSFEAEKEPEISTYLRIRKNYFGQELFTFLKETHLNVFLGESWNLVVPISPSFLRSVTVNRIDQRYTVGRRLSISNTFFEYEERRHRESRDNGKDLLRLKNFVSHSRIIVELCAYSCLFTELPKSLKSLCCSWQKDSLHKLPTNLRSLRLVVNHSEERQPRNAPRQNALMRQNMRIRNNDDYILLNQSSGFLDDSELEEAMDSYSLQHLTKLKYLVVVDADIKPNELKKLLLLAISQEYRMLAVLDSKDLRWRMCIQEGGSHVFPQLENHCRRFRRRLLQCLVVSRTTYISCSFFREEVLQFCSPPSHFEDEPLQ